MYCKSTASISYEYLPLEGAISKTACHLSLPVRHIFTNIHHHAANMTANDLPKDGPSRPQAEAVPYQGDPLPNVAEDLVIPNVLSLDFDERLWVPQAKV